MNRADHRRQLKEDEKLIAKGLDAGQLDASEVVALMRVIRDKLKVCIERRSVTSLMHFLHANLSAGAKHIADVPIDCRKGCSYCCNIWVDAMPPEIFYAVKGMRAADKATALANVEKAIEITGGKTFDERGEMVTPCPLLTDNLCSIYDQRPINCRTAVSADVSICERSYLHVSGEDIPTPMVWVALRQGYGLALEGALTNAGLVASSCEWNEALRLAMVDEAAEARWLAGEDVFAGIQRAHDGSENPYLAMFYREAFG